MQALIRAPALLFIINLIFLSKKIVIFAPK